jgi:hypothetical protein
MPLGFPRAVETDVGSSGTWRRVDAGLRSATLQWTAVFLGFYALTRLLIRDIVRSTIQAHNDFADIRMVHRPPVRDSP